MAALEWLGSDTFSPGGKERWACSQNQEPFPRLQVSLLSLGTAKISLGTHSFFVVISFSFIYFPKLTPKNVFQIQNLFQWPRQSIFTVLERTHTCQGRDSPYLLMKMCGQASVYSCIADIYL